MEKIPPLSEDTQSNASSHRSAARRAAVIFAMPASIPEHSHQPERTGCQRSLSDKRCSMIKLQLSSKQVLVVPSSTTFRIPPKLQRSCCFGVGLSIHSRSMHPAEHNDIFKDLNLYRQTPRNAIQGENSRRPGWRAIVRIITTPVCGVDGFREWRGGIRRMHCMPHEVHKQFLARLSFLDV